MASSYLSSLVHNSAGCSLKSSASRVDPDSGIISHLCRFVYDLPVPSSATAEEQEMFCPKPLDGEVERFEVNLNFLRKVSTKLIFIFGHHSSSPSARWLIVCMEKCSNQTVLLVSWRFLPKLFVSSLYLLNHAVLIDFLIRHGIITPENEPYYLEIVTRLHGRFNFDRWWNLNSACALSPPFVAFLFNNLLQRDK